MKMTSPQKLVFALVLSLGAAAQAAVLGFSQPAPSLTADRMQELPPATRDEWLAYLERSQRQRHADQAALAAERVGLTDIASPPAGGHATKSMPLTNPGAWYAGEDARLVAENILSFQTPAGGWGKNQPRDRPARLRGQDYVANNNAPNARAGDFDLAADPRWSYVGTIDNDATVTEIRFLAKVAAQLPPEQGARYRDGAVRGMSYLLAAQFPNGGWPQVWPLQGGYHDALTLNDNAMVDVTVLMGEAARGDGEFGFLPMDLRARLAGAERRALDVLLAAQLSRQGRRLLWAQQYDALTLRPVAARNYEPAALCTGESVDVLLYLMSLPEPSPAVIEAVRTGVASLGELGLDGWSWVRSDEAQGRRLIAKPGAPRLWARYYLVDTGRPVFGDRDKSLHDDVNEISLERRNGYAWFGTWPVKALTAYERWAARWLKSAP